MAAHMSSGKIGGRSTGLAAAALMLLASAVPFTARGLQITSEFSYASNQTVGDDRWYVIEQRGRFLQAEAALGRRDMKEFHALREELKDYPLYPYLEFADLSRR